MIKLANLREKQIRNCFESYVVVPPISAIAEEHSAAPAGSGSGRGGTRRDFSPAESAFHRQVSAQRCLKSSPDSFFFFIMPVYLCQLLLARQISSLIQKRINLPKPLKASLILMVTTLLCDH